MDSSSTPEQKNVRRHPNPTKSRRPQAHRHEDGFWTWPKVLSFISSEEVLALPIEIRNLIKEFLQEESLAWV